MGKIDLFISYSHEDRDYFKELKKYVNNTNCPNINVWDDGLIEPGMEWDEAIKDKLNKAQIILLLVSQDFLNSSYIDQIELKTALLHHEQKKCRVIPIFTKTCYLGNYPQITKLQGMPAGMKFLSDLGEQVYTYYTEIQKEIMEIASDMLTDMNIHNSIVQNTAKSGDAKAIEDLREKQKIFLSLPASEEGRKKRKSFIIQAEGKIKYEGWPYEVVPSIQDADALMAASKDELLAAAAKCINDSVYSIHIVSAETDLADGADKMQYDLAKSIPAGAAFHKRIVWLLSADLKAKVGTEVNMNPVFTGNDYEYMFDLIKSLDAEKDKKINALKKDFSPNKKVFMFYDFSKDHDADLRIQLKTKIEEDKSVEILPSLPNGTLSSEQAELEKCEGACIFYGKSDPEWFLMRQHILIASGKTSSKAICVDEPGIEKKIERDVSKNAVITIRGSAGIDNGVKDFLDKLKLEE